VVTGLITPCEDPLPEDARSEAASELAPAFDEALARDLRPRRLEITPDLIRERMDDEASLLQKPGDFALSRRILAGES
jgi:hypothetical protein